MPRVPQDVPETTSPELTSTEQQSPVAGAANGNTPRAVGVAPDSGDAPTQPGPSAGDDLPPKDEEPAASDVQDASPVATD
jgi:hypothetical protein